MRSELRKHCVLSHVPLKTAASRLSLSKRLNLSVGLSPSPSRSLGLRPRPKPNPHPKAAIIPDFSATEFLEVAGPAFTYPLLAFVNEGGRLCFPVCEGLPLLEFLQGMFQVTWRPSAIYKSSFGAMESHGPALDAAFPGLEGAAGLRFTARAHSYRGVPVEERCFGVMPDSVRMTIMGAEDDIKPTGDDYDVCVATHAFGKGRILYIGDEGGEPASCELAAAFCLAAVTPISEENFTNALRGKAEGNSLFTAEEYNEAAARYSEAIAEFGDQGTGSQRALLAVLHGNCAEALLRAGRVDEANAAARAALAIEPENAKALSRIVRSCCAGAGAGARRMNEAVVAMKHLERLPREKRGKLKDLQKKVAELVMRELEQAQGVAAAAPPPAQREVGVAATAPPPAPWAFYEGLMSDPQEARLQLKQAKRSMAVAAAAPPPASWAKGLTRDARAAWLLDAFRLRCADEEIRLTQSESTVAEFWVFCRLSLWRGVVPQNFDWESVTIHAADKLDVALSPSAATQQWGAARPAALRAMADRAYGYSAEVTKHRDPQRFLPQTPLNAHVIQNLKDEWDGFRDPGSDEEGGVSNEDGFEWHHGLADDLFREVGGSEAWKELFKVVYAKAPRGDSLEDMMLCSSNLG